MIKVVFDTNIFISALFWDGAPRRLTDLAITGKIKSFSSVEILEEIQSVLTEDFLLPYERTDEVLRDILSYSHLVATNTLVIASLRDKADAKIIACAVSGKADYIVTGDKDLLTLKQYAKISILTVSQFLKELPTRT